MAHKKTERPLFIYPYKCPYCGGEVLLKKAKNILNDVPEYLQNKNLFICENFPKCDTYVVQANNKKMQGFLADRELRSQRKKTHIFVDFIWKTEILKNRSECYKWLAKKLKIKSDKCHIAMFNRKSCLKTQRICKSFIINNFDKIKTYKRLTKKEISFLKKYIA